MLHFTSRLKYGNGVVVLFKMKTFFSVLFISILFFGVGDTTFAKSSYKINSLEELKLKIEESNGDIKLEEIIEDTEPKVLEEYFKNLGEDLKNLNTSLNNVSQSGDNSNTYDLPKSGGSVEIETSDELLSLERPPSEIMPFVTVSKPFGSHQYKIVYRVKNTLLPDANLGLVTYYKVSAKGLTATSCSNAGSTGSIVTDITASCKITDDIAEKVGYDINAQGDFKVTNGLAGINYSSIYVTIVSSLTWKHEGITAQSIIQDYTVSE